MSEEPTDRLESGAPFETRVLRALETLSRRLTSLEERVDARLRETRPIWEAVLSRLESVEARFDGLDARLDGQELRLDGVGASLGRIEAKVDIFGRDLVEARTDIEVLKRRSPAA